MLEHGVHDPCRFSCPRRECSSILLRFRPPSEPAELLPQVDYPRAALLGTGVESVDHEHRQLIETLNSLMEASSQGKSRGEIGRMMDFLRKCAESHFQSEEAIMDERQCPSAAQNRRAHAQLLGEFRALSRRLDDEGPTLGFVIEVQRKAANGLIAHIHGCDTQLMKCQMAGRS